MYLFSTIVRQRSFSSQWRLAQPLNWGHQALLTLFVVGSLLLLPQVVYAQSAPVSSATWGSFGTGNLQFNTPTGIAVASDGSIYVVDNLNNRLQKLDSTGAYLTKWGSLGTGDGQFNNPIGVALDSSGNVYVTEKGNSRIQKFNSNGGFIAKWGSYGTGDGQFITPHGVALDSSNNLYIIDYGEHRVQKFTSTGVFLAKWGSYGTGDGQFNNPVGVAVDSSGHVYVGDMGNNRVQKFTSTGTFLAKWGSTGSGNGQFNVPLGLAVDSSNNVYVADTSNNRIQRFDGSGNYLADWSTFAANRPWGVAVDSSGNIYITDLGNHRVQKFVAPPPTPTPTPTATSIPPLLAPNLNIPSTPQTITSGKLTVPVIFTSNGSTIASVGFALTYDTVCLNFDPTDANNDGLPDAIRGLPAAFAPSLSYNVSTNALEVALYDDIQPINSFSDGALLTVEFTVKLACITTDGSSKTVTVGFAASPAPSFGAPTGQDVTGTATGATITLRFNAAPTALALSNSSVAENSAISTTVGTLSTTDLDASDSFTYSLVSGTGSADNASFALVGATLKTAAIFDYETKPSYTVRVRTTDSGGLFFEQSFPITITDVAEVVTAVDDLVDPRVTVFRGGQTNAIDVLANDIATGGVLRVASVSQPVTGGGTVLNNTTAISYTAPQASGNVTFTYQATDGTTTSNPATVRAAYVANHARGDCNGNGNVAAADFIGVVLEIFDTNDTLYAGLPAWWLGYTGDYPGSPLGCDANNSGNGASFNNDSVTAADIICTVLIFFGHECGGVQAAGATATAHLAVVDTQASAGATTTLTVTLNTGDNAIAAATFALELDPTALHFDPTDANEDGVPDAITLNTPAGMSQSASWNAEAHRLEVALFGLSLPLPTLKDGTLATVTLAVDPAPPVSTTPLALDLVSFSDPDGNDLPFTEQDGTLTIDTSNVQRSLFLPLVVR